MSGKEWTEGDIPSFKIIILALVMGEGQGNHAA